MASSTLPKLALRQTRWALQRRAASSTSEAASNAAATAKESASNAASKAQQGLSRVTSSAGSAVSGAASAASKALSGIGGRTGAAIGFVQRLIPPTMYYARVAGELGKIVFHQRGMAPPNMQTIQSYLTPLQNALRNPSAVLNRASSQAAGAAGAAERTAQQAANSPEAFLTRARNLDAATLTTIGVVAAETLGFFTVGEMIGRFKLVGYRSSAAHGEHH